MILIKNGKVIEKNTLSNEELKQFITEGKLNVE